MGRGWDRLSGKDLFRNQGRGHSERGHLSIRVASLGRELGYSVRAAVPAAGRIRREARGGLAEQGTQQGAGARARVKAVTERSKQSWGPW